MFLKTGITITPMRIPYPHLHARFAEHHVDRDSADRHDRHDHRRHHDNSLTLTFHSRANSSVQRSVLHRTSSKLHRVPAPAKVTLYLVPGRQFVAAGEHSPTGCTSVPFNPTTSVTPGNTTAQPGDDVVSSASTFLTLTRTIQNSLPKFVDVDFPNGSGLDLDALAGVTACTEAQLQAQACPANSIIGNATALSKFLPSGTAPAERLRDGPVGNQVPIGVQLIGPRDTVVIFRGTLGSVVTPSLVPVVCTRMLRPHPAVAVPVRAEHHEDRVQEPAELTSAGNGPRRRSHRFNGTTADRTDTVLNRTTNTYTVDQLSAALRTRRSPTTPPTRRTYHQPPAGSSRSSRRSPTAPRSSAR